MRVSCYFTRKRINPYDKSGLSYAAHRFIYSFIEAGHLARLNGWMEIPMKTLILAAFAALSLSAAVAPLANAAVFHNGSSVASDSAATRFQQTGAY